MARPKTKTSAQITNDYQRRAYEAIRYQTRKDAEYNKSVLQAAADRLTGGSITALLNAAIADYLPRALGDDLEAVKAEGRAKQAEKGE